VPFYLSVALPSLSIRLFSFVQRIMSKDAIIGTPQYTLAEAGEQAKKALSENYGADPWETFGTKNDDVRAVYNKVFCVSKDKVPIFVSRASILLNHPADKVFQTIWDTQLELKWNVSTISSIEILENRGTEQVIYQQHKTLSAASARRDIIIERTYVKNSDGSYWITATSHKDDTKKAVAREHVRAKLVFSGIQVRPSAGKPACEVSWVWCFDFCGWLHAKFIEQEFNNLALRLSRIGKNVPTGSAPAPVAHAPQALPARPEPVNVAKGAGFCPKCGTARGEGKFCGQCGELLSLALGSVV